MSKELVLQTADLKTAGINTQLTSNDLLEVIANDIYEKILSEVHAVADAEKVLRDKYASIMKPEFDQMRDQLVSAKMLKPNEEFNTGYSKVNGDDWQSCFNCIGVEITERDKGTLVKRDHRAFSVNYPKSPETKVLLKISTDNRSEDKSEKINGISCKINVETRRSFEKVITISTNRFKELIKEIRDYNVRVDEVMRLIPPNGLLSYEKFTRDARVKMNKKILSSQPEEFRKKISNLFNIKL